MTRTAPDNTLVTWNCCGHRWEIILTPLHPDRDKFTPVCGGCGQTLLPASLQYTVQMRKRACPRVDLK